MSLRELAMLLKIIPPAVGYWSPFPHKGVRVVEAWHLGLLWFQSDLKPSIKRAFRDVHKKIRYLAGVQ